ncbi:hemoblobin-interacting domain-containing protein [Paenibacillus cymbidii]|uniref:hemoblobin-interacting domain-containing protein n=1 Tax=Paenibacillus cymbidii TaxID=1639034 RepID=UPI0010803A3F|nr:InlB B-repeat-containing protein [Paenibacillus cymbidii]
MIKRIVSFLMTAILLATLIPAAYATSPGSSWIHPNVDLTGQQIYGAAYGNDKYVAGTPAGSILYSDDGLSWNAASIEAMVNIDTLGYGGGKYVAFGTKFSQPYLLATSEDGMSWSQHTLPADIKHVIDVEYGNDIFVAVGESGYVATSPDGISWTTQNAGGSTTSLFSLAYGNGTFVAVGPQGAIMTSADNGVTWTARTSGTSSSLSGIVYGENQFVVVGADGTIRVSSDNGVTWAARISGINSEYIVNVSYGQGKFVAVSNEGTVLSSADGSAWSIVHNKEGQYLLFDLAYGSHGFVAVGSEMSDGYILRSPNVVIYDGNGNTGGSVPEDSNDYTAGASATVLDNSGNLTKTGYTFAGWNTKADGTGTDYAAAATVSVGSADTVLYAKWTASSGGGDNGEFVGVSLDATKYSLPVGGTHTTVLRTNASDNSSAALSSGVTFESSNTAVATVNASTGVVTAVAKGTVTISTYYSNDGTDYRRFATVTVDPKAPSYVEASDKKAGGIYLSVLDPSGAAVKGATVKIASGSKVYPLVTTDDNGRVLKYVPAGTYSVTVYAPNGTTLKNYTTKSLKVVAGQRSEPFAKQQLSTGAVSFETTAIASADKTITGTAPTGTVVAARVGTATIGTAKADKTGKFTIKLKTAQPGKTVTVTAVDTEENEKTVALTVAKAPAVTLTAATKNNDASHDIAITFKDTIGLLPTTVTAVTYNGTPLVKDTAYTIAKGKLTIKKGTFGTPGSYPLVVKSSAYEDASVTQTIVEKSGKK